MRLNGIYHVRVLERMLNVRIPLQALILVERMFPHSVKVHITPRGMILVDICGLTVEELKEALTNGIHRHSRHSVKRNG